MTERLVFAQSCRPPSLQQHPSPLLRTQLQHRVFE